MATFKTKIWLGLSILLIPVLIIYGVKSSITALSAELENSIPRKYAIEKAKNNLNVLKAVGKTIEVQKGAKKAKNKGTFSLSLGGSDGFKFSQDAIDTKIYLRGEIDTATLIVIAKNIESKWVYSKLFVIINRTGEKINLL